ncbi:MAG: lysine--tRNA ligase [bacterium]|nr:lysine--tRNA ligase [bacterium]
MALPGDEIRANRIKKLGVLKDKNINPYPARVSFDVSEIAGVSADFKKLLKKKTGIAGRVMAKRGHGAIMFLDIFDGTGKLQVFAAEDKLGKEQFQLLTETLDIGDFAAFYGKPFYTKKKEATIEAGQWQMLTKSLLPLPEKWHGLQDVEEKLRKRYLDILFNDEVRDMLTKRSVFWNSMRKFLLQKGFLEVETPVLEVTPGGADARPFVTHHNALDLDVYLRISAGELWQKRLMVAGFPKTFEIGRIFRNEGMDAEHLQDYTQMEFYMAYADYEEGMKFVEEMYKYVIKKTFGTLKFKIKGHDVDFSKKWEKYDYITTIKEHTGIDVRKADLSEMEGALGKLGINYDKRGFNITRAIDNLWKYCRKNIGGPGFLINVPVVMEPLAKRIESDRELVQRFQVIIGGSENGKGFSELNDPIDQAERLAEQQKLRDQGDEEAQMFDEDFVEALEYGMPPACGFGVSERLFAFLMDKPARETQIFPLMKPKQ